jgi:phosphonate transport system substrate-binding protein
MKPPIARPLAALAVSAAAALVAAGCGGSSSSSTSSSAATSTASAAVAATTAAVAATQPAGAACPNGQVQFGVEPYDSGPKFTTAYQNLAKVLQAKLGCPVNLVIAQNYTAEVEAMRAGKLDIGEFGPLGYVFAKRIAGAEPVATFSTADSQPTTYTAGLWVPKSSPIRDVAGLKGHTIAFSDPASTSGNLAPRFALVAAGLNPAKDVKIQFAGSHSASLLALVNKKVDAAEVNSQQQDTATKAGQFKAADFSEIWKSAPIPNDPVTVRSSLPPDSKDAVTSALLGLTPSDLTDVNAEIGAAGPMIAADDGMYKPVYDLVDTLKLDISAIG